MTIKDVRIDDDQKLPIGEFKLERMVKNPSIVMISKRGGGKTWVCRAILARYKHIPVGIIIAPTDRMNGFFGKFFPDSYIHYEYTSEKIKRLLYRQKKIIDKYKEKYKHGKKLDPHAFIVMDDCLSRKKAWIRDEPIIELLFNGRHYKIMYILTMQDALGITPELRGNFDYIFLLAEDFHSKIKRIYEHYAGMFPDLNSFRQVFMQLTADYGCMVIANRGARRNFLDKIYWYKAPNIYINDICCDQFREYHEKNYNKNWRKKANEFDIDEFCLDKKKEKAPVKIKKVK